MIERLQAIFDNIAGRSISGPIAAEFLDAIVADRNLDPNNTLTTEEKAGAAIQWLRGVLKDIRANHAAEALRTQAAALYETTLTDSEL
jgi:hypothetical protein